MALSAKTIRARIHKLQPLMKSRSLETIRRAQNLAGELIENKYRKQVLVKTHTFENFSAAWILPRDERRQGVILYLHGGGFVCGDMEYAKAFGSVLAFRCSVRVLSPAYRLAPEHPFPAALEDAVVCYQYLLDKGYDPSHITLCGESAGGGLCYSLCLKLKERKMPLPGGIVTISPWTDLTLGGESYRKYKDVDLSISVEQLNFYARSYTEGRKDPLASPLYGDLGDMPPTIMFAGSDELMLSDAQDMHRRLQQAGNESTLYLKPDRWHGYLLYGLAEDLDDFDKINEFLSRHMCPEDKLRWMPLDNSAKIYPAARNQNWSNVFRLSVTLTEEVDTRVLQGALDVTVRRFPSIGSRLRRGLFWYYLEQLPEAPSIREENSYPLAKMSKEETRQCALRVIVYQKRIALEMFHSIADGNSGMIFLKSLLAEYLQQKYGIHVPPEHGVLGRLEEPSREELEDSFLKHCGTVQASRSATDAYRVDGTRTEDGFLHVICFQMPVKLLLEKARAQGVTLTTYLCAAMMMALQNHQKEHTPNPARQKHVKVLIPVNLRKMFGSKTLRNFILYVTPEIDPRLGDYSFEEVCKTVHHHMGLEMTEKKMRMMITTNVNSEKSKLIKAVPLFLKNPIMKLVFNAVGERKSSLSMSNLGMVQVPEAMKPYVERFDFILGVQSTSPYNCGLLSYGDTVYMNFIRNIREPELEYHFYRVMRELGIPVTVESNG